MYGCLKVGGRMIEQPKQMSANASQNIMQDMAMPLMRERIESPLSPFAYKDELENALKERIFKGALMSAT